MKEREVLDNQIQLNAKFKAIDDLYHAVSVKYHMSDSALWIFYTLRIVGKPITQSELCNHLFQSKQTINSSLKKLMDEEYLTFQMLPDNKKNKFIVFTDKGIQIVQQDIDPIIRAESNVLNRLGDERCKLLLDIYDEYYDLLKEEMGRMDKNE